MIRMYKQVPDTVHWAYGIDVFNKNEFDVPEHLVGEFKSLGYFVKEDNNHVIEKQDIAETKTETKEFKCSKCGKVFNTNQKLMLHEKFCKGK